MHPRNPTKPPPFSSKFLLISMASLLFLSLVLFFSLSSAVRHHHNNNHPPSPPTHSIASVPPEIHQVCTATRYPDTCETSLVQSNHVPPNPTPVQIIQSAIWVSSKNLETAQSMVRAILDSSAGSLNRSTASKNCLEVLHNSEYRISSTAEILPRGRTKDGRAYMSAALLFQYDCWSALKYANDTDKVNETMAFLDSLMGLTSNALSMIRSYDLYGNETGSWAPPVTERAGFWEGSGGGSGLGYNGGLPSGLTADVTVCKGKCDYGTVQEAVNKAPENLVGKRFVIGIKEGVYEETVRVPLEKKNLVFLGDGMGKTVITGSLNVGQPGVSTYNSATVGK